VRPGWHRRATAPALPFSVKEFIDDIHGIVGKSCNHNRAPSYFIELLDKELAAQSGESCRFALLPCGSTDDYGQGTCFQCPVSGCPQLGLATDVTQNTPGKFYFDTLKDDTSFGQFCGGQSLLCGCLSTDPIYYAQGDNCASLSKRSPSSRGRLL